MVGCKKSGWQIMETQDTTISIATDKVEPLFNKAYLLYVQPSLHHRESYAGLWKVCVCKCKVTPVSCSVLRCPCVKLLPFAIDISPVAGMVSKTSFNSPVAITTSEISHGQRMGRYGCRASPSKRSRSVVLRRMGAAMQNHSYYCRCSFNRQLV
jgi:hypothetical protein